MKILKKKYFITNKKIEERNLSFVSINENMEKNRKRNFTQIDDYDYKSILVDIKNKTIKDVDDIDFFKIQNENISIEKVIYNLEKEDKENLKTKSEKNILNELNHKNQINKNFENSIKMKKLKNKEEKKIQLKDSLFLESKKEPNLYSKSLVFSSSKIIPSSKPKFKDEENKLKTLFSSLDKNKKYSSLKKNLIIQKSKIDKEFTNILTNLKIDKHYISIIVNWLLELTNELEISRHTFILTIHLLYKFLSNIEEIDYNKLQLNSLTALSVALKLEEVKFISLKQLIRTVEEKHCLNELIINEIIFLGKIDCEFYFGNFIKLSYLVQELWDKFVSDNILFFEEYLNKKSENNFKKTSESLEKKNLKRNTEKKNLILFRDKNQNSYLTFRWFMDACDFIFMKNEFEKKVSINLGIIFYFSIMVFSKNNFNEDQIDKIEKIIFYFLEFSNLILDLDEFKIILSKYYNFYFMPRDLVVPDNSNSKTYEEFLNIQTYNDKLFDFQINKTINFIN